MHTLIVINDPPYGTERLYNGLIIFTLVATAR